MSLEFVGKIICDGCGATLESYTERRSTHAGDVYYALQTAAKVAKWTFINRGGFHTRTHYCLDCADKPMKPVSRQKTVDPMEVDDSS